MEMRALIGLLQEAGVHAWEITQETTRGWEFYFIRHALDQNRAKDVEHLTVRVYQLIEDGAFLGSAGGELPPTAGLEEARAFLKDLAYRATLVKNKPYTLQPLTPAHQEPPAPVEVDVAAVARDFLTTLKSLPETPTEDVNSYEIFVSQMTRRLVTSQGIDVTQTFPASVLEAVINARKEGHEIELYRYYRSGGCDAAGLRRDLTRTMQAGKDRLTAVPTPALGQADVLFSTRDACSIYDYFVDRLDPQMIVRQMSDWKLGEPIAQGIRGDRITLRALRELENSSVNLAFDAQGAPITDTVMMEDSVPRAYLGGRMFSCYLGLEHSFQPTNIAVEGGSATEAEIRRGKYLEVVEFSDFQVDPMTGDIFGEIRLGYLHDGDRTTPVSGGSISGSMRELVRDMVLSRETVQYNSRRIPAVTLLKNVTVTGIGE